MKRTHQTIIQAIVLVVICIVLLSRQAVNQQPLYSSKTQANQLSPTAAPELPLAPNELAKGSLPDIAESTAVTSNAASTSTDGDGKSDNVAGEKDKSVDFEGSVKQEAIQPKGPTKDKSDSFIDKPETLLTNATTSTNQTSDEAYIPPEEPQKEIEIIPGMKPGKENLTIKAFSYLTSIMDPNNTDIERLKCTPPQTDRYDYLKWENTQELAEYEGGRVKARYLVALDLYKCVDLLPRLMGTVVELAKWVGPENIVVSVVEGRSDDGTYEVLALLDQAFTNLGVRYYLTTNEVNPVGGGGVDRIEALADLRNEALAPLLKHPLSFSDDDPVILFINDVAVCLEDLLELLHQQVSQSMDMACGMDWIYDGHLFYDVWVTRSILGQIFFEIPQDGSWGFSGNLLFDDPVSKRRRDARVPFQVYACWNGVSVIRALPFLDDSNPLRFRRSNTTTGECMMGEPTLLCKDLWRKGYGRIAVVPSVNVGYDDQASWGAKNRQGTVSRSLEIAKLAEEGYFGKGSTGAMTGDYSDWTMEEEDIANAVNETVDWQKDPPALVKCLPDFTHVSWVPPLWP